MDKSAMTRERVAANRRCRPTYQYAAAPIYSYKVKIFMPLVQIVGGNAVLRHVVCRDSVIIYPFYLDCSYCITLVSYQSH